MPKPSSKERRFQNRRRVLLLQYWWQDRVFRGVADYARKHDWVLNCEMRWTRRLPRWTGDGIIAFVGVAHPQRDLIQFIRERNVPVVETQTPKIPGSGAVFVPYEGVAEMAAEHLLSLQFHHIGYVSFEENLAEAMRRKGVARKVSSSGATFHALDFKELPQQLKDLPTPLGLVALNDINAETVMATCIECGFDVPEEVAVVGADDTEIFCDLATVPLTSVNCNRELQGYKAAALLDAMMDGEPAPKTPIIIPPLGITVRRSTDTVAIPDASSRKMLRYLRDHFREPLNLAQAARDLGVTMRRVQQNFREHLGRSIIQELVHLRIEHAKKLLADPDLKVEVVGMESGFGNRPHFIKTFAKVTGQTPRQFRASILAKRITEETGESTSRSRTKKKT